MAGVLPSRRGLLEEPWQLDDSTPDALLQSLGAHRPVVIALSRPDDEEDTSAHIPIRTRRIRRFLDVADDFGWQTPGYQLTRILLRRAKAGARPAALLDGAYSTGAYSSRDRPRNAAGQFRLAVLSLLRHALPDGAHGIFLIRIREGLFKRLNGETGVVRHVALSKIDQYRHRPSRRLMQDYPGNSEAVRLVWEMATRAAKSSFPVLLRGESGTGKRRLASLIHALGMRAKQHFAVVDCSAFTEAADLEREIFGGGSGKGRIPGRWESVAAGTLYLANIEALPGRTQVRVANALRDPGPTTSPGRKAAPARIIASTTADLAGLASQGRFDRRLFCRASEFPIDLPALRERAGDIPAIADTIWQDLAQGKGGLKPELQRKLAACPWPDNIRGLRLTLHRLYNCFGERPQAGQLETLLVEDARPYWERITAPGTTDFLQHLRRTAELARRLEIGLSRLGETRPGSPQPWEDLRRRLAAAQSELQHLMSDPLLFHDESVWLEIDALEQDLAATADALTADDRLAALAAWTGRLQPRLPRVLKTLFGEARRIRREV
jgi:hypothetical protein